MVDTAADTGASAPAADMVRNPSTCSAAAAATTGTTENVEEILRAGVKEMTSKTTEQGDVLRLKFDPSGLHVDAAGGNIGVLLKAIGDVLLSNNADSTSSDDDEEGSDKAGDDEEGAEGEKEERGAKCEVKPLFAIPRATCTCCVDWADEKPGGADLEKQQARAKTEREKFALVHRLERHGDDDGDGGWRTKRVDIQSARLREKLETVFQQYTGVDTRAMNLSFSPPFTPFVHRWEKLEELMAQESEDEEVKKHLQLLHTLMRKECESLFRAQAHLTQTGRIEFEFLQVAFIPGEVVLSTHHGQPCAGILREVQFVKATACSRARYDFEVDVVDWEGERFGALEKTWQVEIFKDSRELAALDVCPLRAHPEKDAIRDNLVRRGKAFEELAGQNFMRYDGKAVFWEVNARGYLEEKLKPLNERVLVDAGAYYNLQRTCPPVLRRLEQLGAAVDRDSYDSDGDCDDDGSSDDPCSSSLTSAVLVESASDEEQLELTDEQRLLTVPFVKGFALERKEWGEFAVDSLLPIEWSDNAFSNLVLDADEKELLLALVSPDGCEKRQTQDDLVAGKGKGIIMLLCGPPGVGKTLTAESVAERVQRPLYRVTAGELGTAPHVVERALQTAFDRCSHWNAVLLIDECDVFLEARSADSLSRNELVSIFLQRIEYYTGIMVLTTNRISNLDPAFESRIDITLAYRALSGGDRAQIWRNLLLNMPENNSSANTAAIGESEIAKLAQKELNGRQIKSAIKTARVLAARQGKPLDLGHLEVVLRLRERARKMLGGDFKLKGADSA